MDILIVAGGTPPEKELLLKYAGMSQCIIAADSGADALLEHGVRFHKLLGDFDSIKEKELEKRLDYEVMRFKREKDFSDTEAAVLEAISMEPENIYILGATGTRIDHFLANISLLSRIMDAGIHGEIVDSNNRIYLIDRPVEIKKDSPFISFSAFTEKVCNFTLTGFRYPLNDYELGFGESLTVSNEIIGESGYVDFKEGRVLVMHTRD